MSNLEKMIEILKENHFEAEARNLEALSTELNSENKDKVLHAINEIQELCQIKALGDLNVNINGWQWLTLVEKVRNTVKKRGRR